MRTLFSLDPLQSYFKPEELKILTPQSVGECVALLKIHGAVDPIPFTHGPVHETVACYFHKNGFRLHPLQTKLRNSTYFHGHFVSTPGGTLISGKFGGHPHLVPIIAFQMVIFSIPVVVVAFKIRAWVKALPSLSYEEIFLQVGIFCLLSGLLASGIILLMNLIHRQKRIERDILICFMQKLFSRQTP